jgi:alpha-L-fucosidase
VNGEAVYGTTASPFKEQLSWGRCTKKVGANGTTLYLHVFNWPADGKLVVPSLEGKVKSAQLLADGKKLETSVDDKGALVITLPAAAPDKISSTIKMEVEGRL